jgi:hypothetical protein
MKSFVKIYEQIKNYMYSDIIMIDDYQKMIRMCSDNISKRLFDNFEQNISNGYAYLTSNGKLVSNKINNNDAILIYYLDKSYFNNNVDMELWINIVRNHMINSDNYYDTNDGEPEWLNSEWLYDFGIDIIDVMIDYIACTLEEI